MKTQKYTVDNEYKSVYLYLKAHGFSENYITNLRKKWGDIVLNNTIVNIRHKLNPNDILELNANPNKKTDIEFCILPLDIVYEDEYYILINKPSGISTMPNKSHYTNNLAGAICNYMKDKDDNFVLRIINRLDKDTSGLVLVAKSSIAQKDIHDIDKEYTAICEGEIKECITINSPILTINENGINQRKRVISPEGQTAITFVSPIKSNQNHSLITLKLKQGRTHQIRVHLSSIGHPLLGDELYGTKSELINHTALICNKLSFQHPYLQKSLSFEVPPPDDFRVILKTLNLQ